MKRSTSKHKNLHQKIKSLELDIAARKASISQHRKLFKEKLVSPGTLTSAFLGGALMGFLLKPRKRSIEKNKNTEAKLPGFFSIATVAEVANGLSILLTVKRLFSEFTKENIKPRSKS